jgi:hypothetical protein
MLSTSLTNAARMTRRAVSASWDLVEAPDRRSAGKRAGRQGAEVETGRLTMTQLLADYNPHCPRKPRNRPTRTHAA